MAQFKTTHPVRNTAPHHPATAHDKIADALKQASSQAKKLLEAQGLKLPTQNWAGSAVRNPVV